MKIKLIKIILPIIIISALIAGCNKQDNNGMNKKTDSISGMMTTTKTEMEMMTSMNNIMNKMMTGMMDIKMTGDYDVDFAAMMIEHHKSALEMSEAELRSGTDEKIKTMAKNIITAQKDEISRMQEFLKKHKPVTGKMKMMMDPMKDMKGMNDMMKDAKSYNNADKDFVAAMIIHHQGAVTMAEGEVKDGMDSEIKKMAEQMIIDQKKEIADFQAWMNGSK
ncbi:hypothetical protein BH10BAC5_BH10BAC5_02350 [soil metagenome]